MERVAKKSQKDLKMLVDLWCNLLAPCILFKNQYMINKLFFHKNTFCHGIVFIF